MQVSSWLHASASQHSDMEKNILVYNGEGADQASAKELLQTAQELMPERKIKFVNCKMLQEPNWADTTDALFMGGGEASQMENALGPAGLKNIFSAVHEKNVAIFATCASSYLFSKERAFCGSGKGIIRSKCPLFNGRAWGPALQGPSNEHYLHVSCAKAANIQLPNFLTFGSSHFLAGRAYFLGGPTFKGKFQTLASYMDMHHGYPEPAVIQVSKRVVFSGPHLEFRWRKEMQTAVTDKHFTALVSELVPFENFRKAMCLNVFQALNLLKRKI